MEEKKKRCRKKVVGSVRDRRQKKKEQHSIIETEDHALDKLRGKLDKSGSLSEQEWRTYEHLMKRKREREVDKVSESENILPQGKLKEWVEKSYIIQQILKAANLPKGKEGIEKLLGLYNFYICSFCGYTHVKGDECPFKIEAEKHNISMKYKPEASKEDAIEREVERMLAEK